MACMMMGCPYVKIHPQTKMMLYAVAEISWEETFSKSWSEMSEYYLKGEGKEELNLMNEGGKVEGEGQGNQSVPNENLEGGREARQGGREGSRGGSPGGKGQGGSPGGKGQGGSPGGKGNGGGQSPNLKDPSKIKEALVLKEASKLKTKFLHANSNATQIMMMIENDETYKWAKGNPKGELRVRQAEEDLKKGMRDFHKEYVINKNWQDLKKKFTKEEVIVELTSFLSLAKKIDHLENVCEAFYKASEVMKVLDD